MLSFYSVLACEETATESDLKSAYQQLLRLTHPDKVEGADINKLNLVRLAYTTLRWVTLLK